MRRAGIVLAVALAAGIPALAEARASEMTQRGKPPTRVVVLFASPPEYPAMRAFGDALRLTMRNELAPPVEFFEEFLDFNRFGGAEHQHQLAQYLAAKYRRERIDLIVAVEVASVGFIREHLREELRGVPIVFGWVAEGQITTDTMPPQVTGVLGPPTIRATVDMALRLHPDTRHIAVISGSSASDRALNQVVRSVLAPVRLVGPLLREGNLGSDPPLGAVLEQAAPQVGDDRGELDRPAPG